MSSTAKTSAAEQTGNREATPKLRFPEFRSEPGWIDRPVSELYEFKPTNTLSRDKLNYEAGTVKNIHYGDIHTRFKEILRVGNELIPFVNPTESLGKVDPESYCAEGDIIFADASEDLADVGKSIEIVALNDTRLLSGTHTLLARRKGTELIVGFGGYLFRSARIRDQIKREAQGSKVFGISVGRLSKVKACFPTSKTEQRKIADCLSSLDEVIAAQARKAEALRAHKHGLMQQLFPQNSETIPRFRFPEFRDGPDWRIKPLGELFETMAGGTPDRASTKNWNGTIPWISTSLIDFQIIHHAKEHITTEGFTSSAAKLFPKDTVLIAMYGQGKTRGKVAMLGIAATTNQACAAILPTEKIDPVFTFMSLSGRYDELRALSNSGGQENLSQGIIRELPFCFPEGMAEQRKIAGCLLALDDLIAAQSQKLKALMTCKNGLMQQLFPPSGEGET